MTAVSPNHSPGLDFRAQASKLTTILPCRDQNRILIGIGGTMNQPVMGGVAALNVPAYIKHQKLINWVSRNRRPDQAGPHLLVRRLAGRVRPPVRRDGRRRHHEKAEPGKAPEFLPGLLRPDRRGARRRPHLHLLGNQRAGRPDQQLDGAGRNARRPCTACSTAAWPAARCTWCRSRWARSVRRSPTSASSCPIRLTWPSTCAS